MLTYSLVIQSFGKESEYRRAVLAVLSYFAYSSTPISKTSVIFFTDRPEWFYQYFEGISVKYILLTPEKIKTMRGKIDFLHRMKIALIEESFSNSSGPLFYTDSDTFFIADPIPVLNTVSEKKAFMHLPEYLFVKEIEDKTNTYKNFFKLINLQDFKLTDGRRLKISSEHYSWNAGVMAFDPTHARLIPDVYALTDQFYPASGSHASEQYAFSIVMQENTQLQRCDNVVYHYWYRVKKQITDQFLEKKLNNEWSTQPLSNKLTEVKQWTKQLPQLFETHVWIIRDHAIQAFNRNEFGIAYKWSLKALIKKPLGSKTFFKDVIYHTKRILIFKKGFK